MEENAPTVTRYSHVLPQDSMTFRETHDHLVALGREYELGDPTEITVEKRVGEFVSVPFAEVFVSLTAFSATVAQHVEIEDADGTVAHRTLEMIGHRLFPYDDYVVTYSLPCQVTCGMSDLIDFDGDDDGTLL